jgi:hypothetical protein
MDGTHLEERSTSDRETRSQLEPSGTASEDVRTAEKEIGKVGKTWKGVGALAQNRIR